MMHDVPAPRGAYRSGTPTHVVAPRQATADAEFDDLWWKRFRLLAENASDVVYETDTRGVIEWISPSVRALLGYEPETLVGTEPIDLVHPDDLPEVLRMRDLVTAGPDWHEARPRVRCGDGSYRGTLVRARSLYEDDGTFYGSVVAVTDAHENSAVLRALTTLSRGNRVLVRATDESTLLVDMCRTLVEAGGYAFAWYGRPVHAEGLPVLPVASAGPHARYVETIQVSWGDNEHGLGPTGRCLRLGATQVQESFDDPRFQPFAEAAQREGFRCSICLPVFVEGLIDGALMVYARELGTFDPLAQTLLEDLARDIGYGLERLRDGARLSQALRSSIFLLAAAVEARDPYTAGHQSQVGSLSEAIAVRLGLEDDVVEGIQLGASIHDLGKITVSRSTLVKLGSLTDSEWQDLRQHPTTGYEIAGRFDWPWPIAEMLYQHHERLNGSGYPRGLKGDDILVEARVIAVADTFEAIGHDRPYRASPGFDVARSVLDDGRGTLFDPDVVDALEAVLAGGFHFPDHSF